MMITGSLRLFRRRHKLLAAVMVAGVAVAGVAVTSSQQAIALPSAAQADSIPDVRMVCAPGQTDINWASKSALSAALEIPDAVADRVISARPYLTPDDLAVVSGIGPGKLAAIMAGGRACATPTQLPPPSAEACSDDRPDLQTASVDELVSRLQLARPAAERVVSARPFAVKRHVVPERVPGIGKGTLDSLTARTCLTPAPVVTDHANYRWVYRDLGGRVARGSDALRVPRGVLGPFGAWASITDTTAPSALTGPVADFHIWAPWGDGRTQPVFVTLPVDPALSLTTTARLAPVVVHFGAGGDPAIYSGDATQVDVNAHTITVATTSLSILQASWFPNLWIISAPTALPLSRSQEVTQTVLEFSGVGASQPSCDPSITNDPLVATNGSMFDRRLATNQPRFRYCVERDTASAVWKLANNSGAAMHVSGVGDPDVIAVQESGDLLTDLFFAKKNGSGPYPGGAYVPPGGTVSVRLPQGRIAATVNASVDAAVNASAYTLRQFDRVLPDDELVDLYNILNECGYSVGLSLGELPAVLRCAAELAGELKASIKKAVEALNFVVDTGTYLADSLRGILDGGFSGNLTYRYPPAPAPGDGGAGGAGPDGSIVGDGRTVDLLWRLRSGASGTQRGQAYLVLPNHIAVSTLDQDQISCLNRRYILRDFASTIPWFQESAYPVICDDTQPEITLPTTARNWVLRMSNGQAWFVNAQGHLENITTGGQYIACVQRYYVLDDYPADLVDRFGDRAAAPVATCG